MVSARSEVRLTQGQAAVLFSTGTALFVVLCIGCALAWNVLWTDILNHNPHRSIVNAVAMVPIGTLFVGIWQAINLAAALFLSGALAGLAAKRFGKVPFWAVLALLPATLGLAFLQDSFTPTASFFLDPPDEITTWDRVWAKWRYAMAPALLLSWAAQDVFFRVNVEPEVRLDA